MLAILGTTLLPFLSLALRFAQQSDPNQGARAAAWGGSIVLYIIAGGVALTVIWYLLRGRGRR